MRHFARVEPIVGPSLRRVRVAVAGLPAAAPLVTHLAACGVRRWLWADPGDGSPTALRDDLLAQHGPALGLDVACLPPGPWTAAARRDPPDLILVVGRGPVGLDALTGHHAPALLVAPPTATCPCQAISLLPGDDPVDVPFRALPVDGWDWITAVPLCAGLARAMLLRDTRYRRTDVQALWDAGARVMKVGANGDPMATCWSTPAAGTNMDVLPRPFQTPAARRGTLLIVGLGSLGSVAAMHLVPHTAGMVVADPNRVKVYNPVRQAYPLATVGRPKAQALRDGLLQAGAQNVTAIEAALSDAQTVADLVTRHGITAALVVTGTAADFAVARALRAAGVPHVVGRCYPRARYWEAILVDGRRGPALEELRGHLRPGPAPPPTPEQIAAYSDAGALEAEPATLVESGWAAAWMARLTAQLLAPPGLRERWLLELLASGRTCLVGGVGVERTVDGPAYGVRRPGEIHAWGRREIRPGRG